MILCKQKVIFVRESIENCAHFRHHKDNEDMECEFYKNNFNVQDRSDWENTIKNKVSNFHIEWQKKFPESCTEIKIYDDEIQTYKRADIYIKDLKNSIKDNQGKYVLNGKNYDLVIEVQNSQISRGEILEREYFYKQKNRQLLWIFNLQNTYYNIEKLVFYFKTIYRIKLIGSYIPFIYLLNKPFVYNKKPILFWILVMMNYML
jgi:hypothetical protein